MRKTLAERLADLLEDSLFYARMYRDTDPSGEGRRREGLIEAAERVVREARDGGKEGEV